MNNKSILFSLLISVGLLASAPAKAHDASSALQSIQQLDFGLFPTKKVQKESVLPDCEDLKYSQEALMGLKSHQEYCIGPIGELVQNQKPSFWIESEIEYKNALVRILKRNPALMPLAKFLKICKPLGGYLSPDGIYCRHVILF